jgi:hypothetical protein
MFLFRTAQGLPVCSHSLIGFRYGDIKIPFRAVVYVNPARKQVCADKLNAFTVMLQHNFFRVQYQSQFLLQEQFYPGYQRYQIVFFGMYDHAIVHITGIV